MIRTPSALEIEALASLEHNPNFKVVVSWLEECLTFTTQNCLSERDEVALRQAQGAAADLHEFLQLTRQARDLAEKTRRQTPQRSGL